ncbi:MAG: FAD-binding oxidoreductase [Proteobacteria bacterium]|nr:FAD-binding oxidoreductase [Pseudomonadota bacterium]
MTVLADAKLAELKTLLGPDAVRLGDAVRAMDPGLDPHNLQAGIVLLPESIEAVQAALRFCHAYALAVVPQGGRTGLAGGAVSAPGQIVLSVQRLNRIPSIDPVSRLAVVEAGVTLGRLDEALEAHGLMAGIDLGARDSATIGGMISTNAGGIEAFRHGVMRQRVSGLEAVLADGTLLSDLTQVGKCNEGYDAKQLFIGAEGTLGVVTRAVLRLVPRPRARATAILAAPCFADALKAFQAVPQERLLAFELMNARYFDLALRDRKLSLPFASTAEGDFFVVELEGDTDDEAGSRLEAFLEEAFTAGWISDAVVAKSEAERKQFWVLREDSWVVERHLPGGLWFDVTVPLAALDDYVARIEQGFAAISPGIQCFIIGHLGDGNLHLTVTSQEAVASHKDAISECVYAPLKPMGGSFSAEHGIGLEKRAALARFGDPGKRKALLAIKQALDPKGLMNPGKIL